MQRKIDQAISSYHARFVAELGEDCPEKLRSTLPAETAVDKQPPQTDPVGQAKQWRHEVTQNEKSIQASKTKLADIQTDIAKRERRNEELQDLLLQHARDICLQDAIDLESVPPALSQQAIELNSRRDSIAKLEAELRKDLAVFERKEVEP